MFADAETLFYHARNARTTKKSLSLDEIQSLLNTATSQAAQPPHEEDLTKPSKPHPPINTPSSDTGKSELQTSSKKISFAFETELSTNEEGPSSLNESPLTKGQADLELKEMEDGAEVTLKEEWMAASDVREQCY